MNKRRIEFIIAGILAICGCAMIVIGVGMGGRPGSFNNVDGRIVYQNSRESIDVADTPSWLSGIDSISIFGSGWRTFSNSEVAISEIEANIEYGHDTDHNDGNISGFNGSSQTVISGEALDISGFDVFNIDIGYGYVTIQGGNNPELRVEGYLSAYVWTEDGVLNIESEYSDKGITNKVIDGITHYYKNGEDITTHFTITLPLELERLDAEIGTGAMEISELNTVTFAADAKLGTIKINNVISQDAELQVDMGSIEGTRLSTENAYLNCNLGAIKFSGNVTEYFMAECTFGSIEASVPQPASYGYNINNNLGSIKLGGNSFEISADSNQEGGEILFDLSCDLGSIAVHFEI